VRHRAVPTAPADAAELPGPPARVLVAGCPVRDEADRVVLATLSRVLETDGYAIQVAPAGALVAETIAAVVEMNPASIIVSSVADSGRARHFVKRLRTACPEISIVAGLWGHGSSPRLRADLCAAGADDVVTTLGQARSDVLRLTPPPERAPADDGATGAAAASAREGAGLAAAAREAT
jgi:hypothetical protein